MTDIDEARAVGWIPDGSTFGARLAMVRQHVGWGNVELAATECGVPVQSWRRWERDGKLPRDIIGSAQAIATRTGCDFLWLLTGNAYGAPRIPTTAYGERRPAPRRPPNLSGSRGPATLRRRPGQFVDSSHGIA